MPSLVSVIITCYNLERYVGAAIESVLSQRYDGQVDLIVVDDCSTDSSSDVIHRYPQVRYLQTPRNSGVLLATVMGLRAAKGDVVLFLDGDDLWHPDKLSLMTRRFEEQPDLGLLTHDLEFIDGGGNPVTQVARPGEVMAGVPSDGEDRMIREGILSHADYVWLGSAYAVKKSAIDADGFSQWAEELPDPANTYQGWPLACWAAIRSQVRMGYLPQKLFKYRLHGANHSGDAGTPEKAVRNLSRTYNTLLAVSELLARAENLPDQAESQIRRKLRMSRYLLDLYRGQRIRALAGYAVNFPYMLSSGLSLSKETMRFIAIQLLGVRGFIRVFK